ncbi:hypothetical protein HGRIS_004413 [Hohenbuehelia grisea]
MQTRAAVAGTKLSSANVDLEQVLDFLNVPRIQGKAKRPSHLSLNNVAEAGWNIEPMCYGDDTKREIRERRLGNLQHALSARKVTSLNIAEAIDSFKAYTDPNAISGIKISDVFKFKSSNVNRMRGADKFESSCLILGLDLLPQALGQQEGPPLFEWVDADEYNKEAKREATATNTKIAEGIYQCRTLFFGANILESQTLMSAMTSLLRIRRPKEMNVASRKIYGEMIVSMSLGAALHGMMEFRYVPDDVVSDEAKCVTCSTETRIITNQEIRLRADTTDTTCSQEISLPPALQLYGSSALPDIATRTTHLTTLIEDNKPFGISVLLEPTLSQAECKPAHKGLMTEKWKELSEYKRGRMFDSRSAVAQVLASAHPGLIIFILQESIDPQGPDHERNWVQISKPMNPTFFTFALYFDEDKVIINATYPERNFGAGNTEKWTFQCVHMGTHYLTETGSEGLVARFKLIVAMLAIRSHVETLYDQLMDAPKFPKGLFQPNEKPET